MIKQKNHIITFVKRSCITGNIVWVYRGKSQEGARKAYWRACKREVRRVRQWMSKMSERKHRLMQILAGGDSSSSYSAYIRDSMSSEQHKAVHEIAQMCKTQPPKYGEFYDHIIEEARRRNWQSERWKDNRVKMFRYGKFHTSGEYCPKNKNKSNAK